MPLKILAAAAFAVGALLIVAPVAEARDVYDDVFFVRQHASAAELFADRNECRTTAQHMSDASSYYSNPEYGALSAMGSALDEDALHDGGLRKRLERAVFMHCMEHKDWQSAAPSGAELKALLRASPGHPEALNAWLKANEPASAPAPPPPAMKTAASADVKAAN
jgi:hypothetical protein